MVSKPIAFRSCYANVRDIGHHHSVWYHKVIRQTLHRTLRDKNRGKMHTQVTTISNVLRFKERLPHWGSLLWASLPISTIPITFAALHFVRAVMITLILMSKHVVGL